MRRKKQFWVSVIVLFVISLLITTYLSVQRYKPLVFSHRVLDSYIPNMSLFAQEQLLAVACWDGIIRIVDSNDGHLIKTIGESYERGTENVLFSNNGKYIAASFYDKNTIRLWDSHTGEIIHTYSRHIKRINALAFVNDDKLIASGDSEGVIKIWEIESGSLVRELIEPEQNSITSMKYCDEIEALICGLSNGSIIVWDINSWESKHINIAEDNNIYTIMDLLDKKYLAIGCSEAVYILNIADWQIEKTIQVEVLETKIAVVPATQKLLVAGCNNNEVRVLDIKTGKSFFVWRSPMHRISSIICSTDGRKAICSTDDTLWMIEIPWPNQVDWNISAGTRETSEELLGLLKKSGGLREENLVGLTSGEF